jgi:hypothetical protein
MASIIAGMKDSGYRRANNDDSSIAVFDVPPPSTRLNLPLASTYEPFYVVSHNPSFLKIHKNPTSDQEKLPAKYTRWRRQEF